ncbi:MAG: magnesium/cobalt transporter CorA [Solirubrobacterales bacterium]|nr:magnesium/cobalt transporter CorA [Solirubrobacterales bacterium]MCB8969722.1 magnesium/cobalt transporter CorA [Thermoleophilales bacterium]MCO5327184.1 magnesium/cobalt transporter CorA [Solirubrobacterales bacterium]
MIVDCAHYVGGARRHEGALEIEEAATCARERDGFVWLGLHDPDPDELDHVGAAFGLHELAVEDARESHQRPKIEDYDGSFFVVMKTARYDDDREEVEFGEINLFLGSSFLIAVRHGIGSGLATARRQFEARPDLVEIGPVAAAWAIIDRVVDDYEPVAAGLEKDITEVEDQVFAEAFGHDTTTQRIYFLKREVIEFHRAVLPLIAPLKSLVAGTIVELDETIARFYRDVADHATRVDDQLNDQRDLLEGVLQANLSLIGLRQNEVVRSISAWAAIIAVPTFIASIYGMNFDGMPELGWGLGYPGVLALMLIAVFAIHRYFKRIEWL